MASVVHSSQILVTLMWGARGAPETSVLARTTLRNITEDDILHSQSRENLNLTKKLVSIAGVVCVLGPNYQKADTEFSLPIVMFKIKYMTMTNAQDHNRAATQTYGSCSEMS
jgi:hypothetical protein